jgi:proteic killer suppression protein
LERYFKTGSKAGIQPTHAGKLTELLTALDAASSAQDMSAPSYRLHALKGELAGLWSLRVNGNWRITFWFEGEDAILVDYQDYH